MVVLRLQSSSRAMGWKYKMHCSFMQLPTLPFNHHQCPSVPSKSEAAVPVPWAGNTKCIAASCNSTHCLSTPAQVCHQRVRLQCSSCAMGWRRTLQWPASTKCIAASCNSPPCHTPCPHLQLGCCNAVAVQRAAGGLCSDAACSFPLCRTTTTHVQV